MKLKLSEKDHGITLDNGPWTPQDETRYNLQMARNPNELSDEEKDELVLLIARKMKTYIQSPKREKFIKLVAQSFSLVDDLVADGAVLTTSDKAKLSHLLIEAGDGMVERFLLIKKAGRIGGSQRPSRPSTETRMEFKL